jgi:hypothetical protein
MENETEVERLPDVFAAIFLKAQVSDTPKVESCNTVRTKIILPVIPNIRFN